jgi:hypothetical protein
MENRGRTNSLATTYDVRTLKALREGIGIKSGSDGSVNAFLAKQFVKTVHACDDGLYSRTLEILRKKI